MTAICADNRMEIKDPQADLDYGWDWTKWLNGDVINVSTWSVSPSGPTLHTMTNSATNTTVWISGGTLDEGYVVTNHITTAAGRQDDRSFNLIIRNR